MKNLKHQRKAKILSLNKIHAGEESKFLFNDDQVPEILNTSKPTSLKIVPYDNYLNRINDLNMQYSLLKNEKQKLSIDVITSALTNKNKCNSQSQDVS